MLAPFAWDARAAEHPAGCALAVPDVTVKRARDAVERLSIEHASRRKRARRASAANPGRPPPSPSTTPRTNARTTRTASRSPRTATTTTFPPRVTRERRSAGEGAASDVASHTTRESGRRRRESDAANAADATADADAADADADVADADADRRAPPPHLRRRPAARAQLARFSSSAVRWDDDDLLSDDTDGSDVVDDDASVHTHSDASLERARGPTRRVAVSPVRGLELRGRRRERRGVFR